MARERPPAHIQVGARDYLIEISAESTQALDCLGATMGQYSLIVLSPNQDYQSLREVTMHELIHAMSYDVDGGSATFLDDETEERVCRHLAGRIVDLLRRNPQLVAYLTAKDEAHGRSASKRSRPVVPKDRQVSVPEDS